MKFNYLHRGQPHAVELQAQDAGYHASVGAQSYEVKQLANAGGELHIEIDGQPHQVTWERQGRALWLHWNGRSYQLEKAAGRAAAGSAAVAERVLRAPMPGQVRKVMAQAGQSVQAGETLLLLEAMKMEIRIQAAHNAKVARVAVQEGQTVEKEQTLVELEPDDR